MFKKIILLCLLTVIVSSCLNNEEPNFAIELLPIDEAIVPDSFIFGQKDTIAIKYTLKNSCYYFDNLYYEYQDSTRVVAVKAFVYLEDECAQIISQKEYKFVVNVTQQEDYVFKFWTGKDSNGENIFEEIIVPVN